jgi:hypothetical protein
MDYGQAEQTISQYLNDKFAEMELANLFFVAPMPESDKEMKDFEKQIDKTRCAVEYFESNFDNSSDLGCIKQMETAKFRLLFDGRKFRGEGGIFRMEFLVKQFLVGYELPDADKMTIAASGKLEYSPDMWLRFIDFECRTMNVQTNQNDAIGGPFQSPLILL